MLQEFGPSHFSAEGPTVCFFGFPYPTRMAVARLSDGSVWVWSAVALTRELEKEVASIGPVRYIVSPNKLHHLFLQEWTDRWLEARLYAPPGLDRKRPDLRFYAQLGDEPCLSWAPDIDQAVFRGSIAMEEVAFVHRASRTPIIGDLIQRHTASKMSGWKGMVMQLDGLVGEDGSTPREWRASYLRRAPAQAARKKVLGWNANQLLIAHGECVHEGVARVVAAALSWI
jgi:hypothetical protein